MSETSVQAQINDLRARVETVEELGRQLQLALSPVQVWPAWVPRLTRREEAVLSLLVTRALMTEAAFEAFLAPASDNPHQLLQAYVLKLRAKLQPFGIQIHNRHGVGFYLDEEARERLREVSI